MKRKTLVSQFALYIYLRLKEGNRSILFAVLGLLFVGLLMSFSLSYSVSKKLETSDFYFFAKHAFFVIIGLGIIASSLLLNLKRILDISFFATIICFSMLLVVLFLGSDVKGATRWIDLGPFSLQPSEIFKPFFIVINGFLIFKFQLSKRIQYLWSSGFLYALTTFLMALEPDYGMIIMYTIIMLSQMFLLDINLKKLVIIFIILSIP
jgi:cell division protein FtsW